jgi:hypothetical protein
MRQPKGYMIECVLQVGKKQFMYEKREACFVTLVHEQAPSFRCYP